MTSPAKDAPAKDAPFHGIHTVDMHPTSGFSTTVQSWKLSVLIRTPSPPSQLPNTHSPSLLSTSDSAESVEGKLEIVVQSEPLKRHINACGPEPPTASRLLAVTPFNLLIDPFVYG